MAGIKSLVKDTAVYGMSSIVGRFLNWCLVPLYVYIFKDPASYGIVSYLYSFTAVALVILNYGMETGFFRFANKDPEPEKVYTTALISVGSTSLLFILLLTGRHGSHRRLHQHPLRLSALPQQSFPLRFHQALQRIPQHSAQHLLPRGLPGALEELSRGHFMVLRPRGR